MPRVQLPGSTSLLQGELQNRSRRGGRKVAGQRRNYSRRSGPGVIAVSGSDHQASPVGFDLDAPKRAIPLLSRGVIPEHVLEPKVLGHVSDRFLPLIGVVDEVDLAPGLVAEPFQERELEV